MTILQDFEMYESFPKIRLISYFVNFGFGLGLVEMTNDIKEEILHPTCSQDLFCSF